MHRTAVVSATLGGRPWLIVIKQLPARNVILKSFSSEVRNERSGCSYHLSV
jgi:hypothetical protein